MSARGQLPVTIARHSGWWNDEVDGELARICNMIGLENASFVVDWYVVTLKSSPHGLKMAIEKKRIEPAWRDGLLAELQQRDLLSELWRSVVRFLGFNVDRNSIVCGYEGGMANSKHHDVEVTRDANAECNG
jgi:hypothetical protein